MRPRADAPPLGSGWQVFIEELSVLVSVGIHDFEYSAPQIVLIDATIDYDKTPDESNFIDYDTWCSTVDARLSRSPHTRLLEDLLVQIATTTFEKWTNVARIRVSVHKPNIRPGARKVGVSLDWSRTGYLRWAREIQLVSRVEQREHSESVSS